MSNDPVPSIYDERDEGRIERELDEALSDQEADALLEKLEARYARFRQEVFAKWPVAKQAAFERRSLLYSCLQARDTVAYFSEEGADVDEGVDVRDIAEHFRLELKRTQAALARLRVRRYAGFTSSSLQ